MEFYINSVVCFSALVQCLLLLASFLKCKSGVKTNLFIIAFISVITIQILIKLTGFYAGAGNIGPIYYISFFIPYLYGPLVYLYVKNNYSDKHNITFTDLFHLLPFIVSAVILVVPGYGIIDIFKYVNIDIYNITDTFIQLILLNSYIFAVKKLLNSNTVKENKNIQTKIIWNWFKDFTNSVWIAGSILIIWFTFLFYNIEIFGLKTSELSFFILVLPAMIFWICYNALINPEIFAQRRIQPAFEAGETQVKYQGSKLREDEIKKIISNVNTYIELKKVFLNPGLSLDSLSEMLNIPRHHISQSINHNLNMNFNEFINSKRVEYAMKELANPGRKHYTIAAIAFESGFNSLSTFNESFKKITSEKPSQYKKHILNK